MTIRCGRSSITGRRRPTASLIDVETRYAPPTHAVARAQRRRWPASSATPTAPVTSHTAPCSPRREYERTQRTVSGVRATLRTRR